MEVNYKYQEVRFTGGEKQKYLNRDDYDRLVTWEQVYNYGIIQTNRTRYKEMKNLTSNKSGIFFKTYFYNNKSYLNKVFSEIIELD